MNTSETVEWLTKQSLPKSVEELARDFPGTKEEFETGLDTAVDLGVVWLLGLDGTVVNRGLPLKKEA